MSTRRAATGLAVALWAVTMVLIGTGLVLAVVIGHNLSSLLWSWSLAEVATAASFSTVGMVLAARRPRNPIGWLFTLLGLSPAGGFFAAQYHAMPLAEASLLVRAGLAVLERMPGPLMGYLVLLLLLFPHGTVLSRR